MPNNHFIAKFVRGTGPEPEEELQHIVDQAENSFHGSVSVVHLSPQSSFPAPDFPERKFNSRLVAPRAFRPTS